MASIESKNLLVWVKAMSRGQALPLDASEIYGSYADAEVYASSATAYAGQTIKALMDDGKYHSYVLQPSDAGYVLEEVGAIKSSDLKQYVIVNTTLPTGGQEQGVIYIETTNYTGSIWTGTEWKEIFRDVHTDVETLKTNVSNLESELALKAPLANPAFTGVVTVDGGEVALKSYVEGLFAQLQEVTVPKILNTDNSLPTTDYKAGETYRVAEAGTYAGTECEAGDLILVINDYVAETASNADFMVLQANIDGAVTSSADTSTVGEIVVFDAVTGKVIKGSGVNIVSLNEAITKAHEHTNEEILDSYDKTQTELLEAAKAEVQGLIDTLTETVNEKANKADTLAGYGITDAYNKSEVDNLLKPITDNLNTKVDSTTVDDKISTANETLKEEITDEYTDYVDTKIGDLGESTDVVTYVNKAVGSGGADVASQIDNALTEAKTYTDTQIASALTIVEF